MKNVYIIAQEFQTPGNCGALARAMKNFGFKNLIFVSPKCDYKSKEAMDRATHAKEVLEKAGILKDIAEVRDNFDYVVGTTAMIGRDFNLPRSPLSPEQLSEKLANVKNKVAIVFGSEGEGLSNEEVSLCDFVVTIPSSKEYPVMNVSHAAAVILYELSKKCPSLKVSDHILLAGNKDKAMFLGLAKKTLRQLEFESDAKVRTQEALWKNIVGKSFLSRRELFALFGFFRKVLRKTR